MNDTAAPPFSTPMHTIAHTPQSITSHYQTRLLCNETVAPLPSPLQRLHFSEWKKIRTLISKHRREHVTTATLEADWYYEIKSCGISSVTELSVVSAQMPLISLILLSLWGNIPSPIVSNKQTWQINAVCEYFLSSVW